VADQIVCTTQLRKDLERQNRCSFSELLDVLTCIVTLASTAVDGGGAVAGTAEAAAIATGSAAVAKETTSAAE